MPTSSRNDRPPRRNGFTLVELMVVLAVVGLVAGAVVLGSGGGERRLGADAARLAGRIAAAREQAIVGGRPTSLWIGPDGYGFDRFERGRWVAVDEAVLAPGTLSAGTRVSADGLAGREQALEGGRIRVLFDNLGLPEAPLSLRLERDGETKRISLAANGDVGIGG